MCGGLGDRGAAIARSRKKPSALNVRQQVAVTKIAALTIANAMVFQEVLAASDGRVQPLRKSLAASDPVSGLADHWRYIEDEIDYIPIFAVARRLLLTLPANAEVEDAVQVLGQRALEIVSKKAALRHDLMGRVYHRLLSDAKYLGTYYTSVPAATMLLKYALGARRWNVDWSDLDEVKEFTVGDLACGTGTLLMAAAEAIADVHVQVSIREGRAPDLDGLHKHLMERVITGIDVQASALHLTASTLALRSTTVSFDRTNLFAVPLGGRHARLGSVEFLAGRDVTILQDLFGASSAPTARVTASGDEETEAERLPGLDLCVMNPPFTRSVGGNLLFGSLPEEERTRMRARLAVLLRQTNARASSTAGLGSVFVAAGNMLLNSGGTMALVLPKALLSGVAWEKTRGLLSDDYVVELLIASHDPERWNFSDNTDLSEVLLVARKRRPGDSVAGARVTAVNLIRNPRTAAEALQVTHALDGGDVPAVERGQGALPIESLGLKVGEAISVPWADLRHAMWMLPCAFGQSDLVRTAYHLARGKLSLPGSPGKTDVPLIALDQLGTLGPDRRDIWDGFDVSPTRTAYAAIWGGAEAGATGLARTANAYLTPLAEARPGRGLRRVDLLWPRAGRIVLAEGLRLNTQGVVAGYVDEPVLSNVWWPLRLSQELGEREEKALVLWLNSTLALLMLLASREETEGAWVGFKKPTLGAMPVLDVSSAAEETIDALEEAYDSLSGKALRPYPEMSSDDVRTAIDSAVTDALGLPRVDVLRDLLGREAIITERPMYETT